MNPDMLVLAREYCELTQSELARQLGTTQGRISKIENGVLPADGALLRGIARATGFTEEFFTQPDSIFGLPVTYHRKKQSAAARVLARIQAEINLRRMHLARLLRAAELDNPPLPQFDADEYGSPEAVAQMLRSLWQLPRGPVKDLAALIEDNGGVVFECDFENAVDGVSQRPRNLPATIYMNTRMPVDRQRFTLAHELGHLIMHTLPTPHMEDEADRFASEFLMPEADIRHELSGLTLHKLAALKQVWRVSMAALIRRARDLRRITERQYRMLCIQMSKLGFRTREPEDTAIEPDRPRLVSELIDFHLGELQYTPVELAQALCMTLQRFSVFYGIKRGTMRLVVGGMA